jgi:selenocysteine lyase/cysteine desulfurase
MKRLNYPSGLVRASFGLYNTREDVDRLVVALKRAVEIFKR